MSSFELGQSVTFTLHSSAKSLNGIIVSLPEAGADELVRSLYEVAILDSTESVQKGVIKDRTADGKRRLTLVHPAAITSTGATITSDEVALLRQETTQHSAFEFYKLVHEPQQQQEFKPGSRIRYAGRVFNEKEIFNLIDSSLEFWLTAGRYTDQFEAQFAKYLGVRKCLLVNSGSSANLVAFSTLTSPELKGRQICKGDEVITVAAGFPTTIAPAIQYGAVPVFVDISIPTYNIDIQRLEEALSDRTRAVMVAHALGNPFELEAVKAFCTKHNLWLVEDNCDALGAEALIGDSWKLTGTVGDMGTSSFYPPHHMTMGEGGAVYSNSVKLDKIAASFRDWGRDCWCKAGVDNTCGKRFEWDLGQLPHGYDHKYIYSHFGYNLKATDMQAAIGCAQIEKIPSFVQARRDNWNFLRESLSDLEEHLILPEPTPGTRPSWFGFMLTLRSNEPGRRSQVVQYLEGQGVQTRMLFAGNFLRQPACDELRKNPCGFRIVGELANSDLVMTNSFWLGVYPGLKQPALEFMAEALRKAVLK